MFVFHARSHHIPTVTDLFRATYDELELLFKAWKICGSLSNLVVTILMEVAIASKSIRYTGGKLAMACRPQ